MKVSHEVPRCLLNNSRSFNDYDYCLPHLLDQDEQYREFFYESKKRGRYIIMDNSLHELGKAYDHKRLLHWIQEIEPDEFIVPDVWMKHAQTAAQAKYWLQYKYPKKTQITAVVQGEDEQAARLCATLLKDLGYKKLNISYGATWYGNTALDKALGRISFVKSLLDDRNWVWDFGGMKRAKGKIDGMSPKDWMDYMFDHTFLVAEDDPFVESFLKMNEVGAAQVRVIPATGAELFAQFIYDKINPFIQEETDGRVKVLKVEFREHSKNSAIYEG